MRKPRRRVRVDVALLVALSLFLCAEVGLRLAASMGGSTELIAALRNAAPQGYYPPPHVFDAECGYRYRPAYRGRFRRTDFDASLVMNEHGFHAPSFSAEKPPGVFRVALMGDSMLAANQVTVDQTWAVQLQKHLAPVAGKKIQVLNFGVDGYLPWNISKLLETRVLHFDPDVVVLWCDAHRLDVGAERYRLATGDQTIWEASDPQLLPAYAKLESRRAPSLRELIPRSSYVARLLNHLVGKVGASNIRRIEEQPIARHDPDVILKTMRDTCAQAGVPLAVFYRQSAPSREHDRCRALGVPTWTDNDVIPDFDSLSWPHDAHFDVDGNAAYAAAVAPVFQEMLSTLASPERYASRRGGRPAPARRHDHPENEYNAEP